MRRVESSGSWTTAPPIVGQLLSPVLQSSYRRLTLVHGPVHASWLNQIEIYFSIVQRKVLSPNDFPDWRPSPNASWIFSIPGRLLPSPLNGNSPVRISPGSSSSSVPRTNPKNTLVNLKRWLTSEDIYQFTFPDVVQRAAGVDVIWFNERKFPLEFIEVENTTDMNGAFLKFVLFDAFYAKFRVVTHLQPASANSNPNSPTHHSFQ